MNTKTKIAALLLMPTLAQASVSQVVIDGTARNPQGRVKPFSLTADITQSGYSSLAYPRQGCGMNFWNYHVLVESITEQTGNGPTVVSDVNTVSTITAGIATQCDAARTTLWDGTTTVSMLTWLPYAVSASVPTGNNRLNMLVTSRPDGIDSSGGHLSNGWSILTSELASVTTVPEPSTLWMLALGLGLFAVRRSTNECV
jgi:hypothetical protein